MTKYFTARKGSLGQGNIFTSVCHALRPRGGVRQTPPHQILWDMVAERAVRILLEYILVKQEFQ